MSKRKSTRVGYIVDEAQRRRAFLPCVAFLLAGRHRGAGSLFRCARFSAIRIYGRDVRGKEQMAAIGTAASILAHEIGNPLNGISATVQLLEHCLSRPTLPTAESMLSSVHDLKSEVKRLTELLSEFKNIAWPQKLALGPVDIKHLIQRLAGEIEKRSLRQNVEVSLQCQAELPLLNGDDDKLKRALHNVLDNALDAMPHGGRLEIKAYQHEKPSYRHPRYGGGSQKFKVFDLQFHKADGIGRGVPFANRVGARRCDNLFQGPVRE